MAGDGHRPHGGSGGGGLALLGGGLAGRLGSGGGLLRGLHVLAGLLRQLLRGETLLGGAHDVTSRRDRATS